MLVFVIFTGVWSHWTLTLSCIRHARKWIESSGYVYMSSNECNRNSFSCFLFSAYINTLYMFCLFSIPLFPVLTYIPPVHLESFNLWGYPSPVTRFHQGTINKNINGFTFLKRPKSNSYPWPTTNACHDTGIRCWIGDFEFHSFKKRIYRTPESSHSKHCSKPIVHRLC